MTHPFFRVCCIFTVLLSCACLLQAQDFRSTLTGRITDSNGSVIPSVKVVMTETTTNTKFTTNSSAEGVYTIPLLLPGTYELSAEASGFKKYVQSGIQVATNVRLTQNIELSVGDVKESITVTGDAPMLETATASTGQTITTREVESLPINGRTPMDLAAFGFGVVNLGNRDQNRPFENAGFSNYTMGGGAVGTTLFLLDGVPNFNDTGGTRAAFSPSVDSVIEVKVEAFNVDASQGGAMSGSVNMTTKAGSNQFHGSLSEFNQASALCATPWFTNASGGKKTVTRMNLFGGTIGGPVWIPHVYDGHNKVFFFFAYEQNIDFNPNPVFGTLPTAKERAGDFSDLLALSVPGKSYQLYDPKSATLVSGKVVRTAFAGNVIPSDRLNPIAVKFLSQYVPLPNQQLPGVDNTKNYFNPLSTTNPYHSYMARSDFNISSNDKLTLRMDTSLWDQYTGSLFNNITTANHNWRSQWGGMTDYVHTFSSTLVGNMRLGYTRFRAFYTNESAGFNPTDLGFPSYIASNSSHLMMPTFSFSDGYSGNNASGKYTDQPLNSYQLYGGLVKIIGNHALKFGGEVQEHVFSSLAWGGAAGDYTFGNNWVKPDNGSSTGAPMGYGIASFLLGLPTAGSFTINPAAKYSAPYGVLYVQDDWHLRPNITLNIGLRWEYEGSSVESHNRQIIGFNPTAVNSASTAAAAAYALNPVAMRKEPFNTLGGVIFADDNNRGSYQLSKKAFSPRFGITWSPKSLHDRTVFRGGFGIFYNPPHVITGTQPGYSQTTSFVPTNDNYLTAASTLNNPFPTGFILPAGNSLGASTALGQSLTIISPDIKIPYAERWTLGIQQKLANNLMLEVGYIGNRGVHLFTSRDINAMPYWYLSTLPTRDTATINALAASVNNPFAGLIPGIAVGAKTTVNKLLQPYPQFGSITMSNIPNGSSWYHSLATRLQKRFSNGLSLFVNYNYSRLMARESYLNAGDPRLETRVSSSDRPHSLAVGLTYELPVGRGKAYLADANRWINGFLGNWSVATTYGYHSGAPFGVGNLIYLGGDLQWNSHNPDRVFDTSRFYTGTDQLSQNFRTFPSQFSNTRVDCYKNVGLTLSKSFNILDKAKLQYRAEGFNLFNRPQFSGFNTTPTSSGFGTLTTTTNTPRLIEMGLRLTF